MRQMRRLFMSAVLITTVLSAVPMTAAAWEEPAHWSDVGPVSDWLRMDAQLYRFSGDLAFLDQSQKNVDQQARYAETREYLGSMDAIGLADFLALPPDEQKARADATKKHRDFVVRFRNRMATYVQQSRAQEPMGWGRNVQDVTTVGNLLRHLRSATGVDPANPYNWHLYYFFAYIAGDLDRAMLALRGAETALSEVPDGEMMELRIAVAMDIAWLERDRGNLAEAVTALERARDLGAEGFEAVLLEGLLAAQTGDTVRALELAAALSSTEIRKYPHNLVTTSFSPELSNMGAWRKTNSNFAQAWITAITWLREGDTEMAKSIFGRYQIVDSYPLPWRFWNDAAIIYDLTGRPSEANNAWNAARMWRPYAPYFPVKTKGADIGRLTGNYGLSPVILAYDTFIIAGNPLAFGFILVTTVHGDPTDMEMQAAAGRALEALERPRKSALYAPQAHILEASVYYRMGDLQSAAFEIEKAFELLMQNPDDPVNQALLQELAALQASRSEVEINAFFKQSGSLESRWASEADPEAHGKELAASYAADPSMENRQALAAHEIRYGDPAAGLELVNDHVDEDVVDLILALQADRARNDSSRAKALAEGLASGQEPFADAQLWTTVGFICLDAGEEALGKQALERALELDPENHALKVQMKLFEN